MSSQTVDPTPSSNNLDALAADLTSVTGRSRLEAASVLANAHPDQVAARIPAEPLAQFTFGLAASLPSARDGLFVLSGRDLGALSEVLSAADERFDAAVWNFALEAGDPQRDDHTLFNLGEELRGALTACEEQVVSELTRLHFAESELSLFNERLAQTRVVVGAVERGLEALRCIELSDAQPVAARR